MKCRLLLLVPLLFAFTGVVQGNANPLTFWWYAPYDGTPEMAPVLECALARVRAATCLPVDISFDAHHWVRWDTPEHMGVAVGHTGGASWASTRIKIRDNATNPCNVLVHELAQHVLRRSNGHVLPSNPGAGLHADLVTAVCSVQACACFNPEA